MRIMAETGKPVKGFKGGKSFFLNFFRLLPETHPYSTPHTPVIKSRLTGEENRSLTTYIPLVYMRDTRKTK